MASFLFRLVTKKPSAFESEIHPSHKSPICTLGISPLQGAKCQWHLFSTDRSGAERRACDNADTSVFSVITEKTAAAFFSAVPSACAAETAATDKSVAKRVCPSWEKGVYDKTLIYSDVEAAQCQRKNLLYHKITSEKKQEYLYAVYHTADNEFWSSLARETQQEFKRSGAEGKCIEARELIIALPEIYTQYEPQMVLEDFTNEFRRRYGVECVSALHHNKRKTNYHIHLIFSERKLLAKPEVIFGEPSLLVWLLTTYLSMDNILFHLFLDIESLTLLNLISKNNKKDLFTKMRKSLF
ncbi:MobA/MobL family protein [Streptococcus massiliensis]|nr:MobA/MobL family protein [Streptococcus massiliensis]